MSTRSQVWMKDSNIYLYQHMDGYNLANEVRLAMQRDGCRLDDDEYLCRVIFCEMLAYSARWTINRKMEAGEEITALDRTIFANEITEEITKATTGFGIGNEIHGDIEFLVTVSVSGQTVEVMNRTWDGGEKMVWTFTFNEFINNDIHDWERGDD